MNILQALSFFAAGMCLEVFMSDLVVHKRINWIAAMVCVINVAFGVM